MGCAGAGEPAGDSAPEGGGEPGARDAGGRAQAPAERGQRDGPPLLVAPPAPPLLPRRPLRPHGERGPGGTPPTPLTPTIIRVPCCPFSYLLWGAPVRAFTHEVRRALSDPTIECGWKCALNHSERVRAHSGLFAATRRGQHLRPEAPVA